ncbi:MAG: class I adenylate cyclase [Desulfobacteraceae bacterium]
MTTDFESFEKEWRSADADARVHLLSRVSEFPLEQAVLPVLEAVDSYSFKVRNKARHLLERFKNEISRLNYYSEDKKEKNEAVKISSLFCARIYSKLISDVYVKDLKYYFEILLESGGRGPFYAWRACRSKVVSVYDLKNILFNISESARLALVDQYLISTPEVRRDFGVEFKRMLNNIKERKTVVWFYASLFDRNRDADPFLKNIPLDLRNPRTIIAKELSSDNVREKEIALKALSRMVVKIDPALLVDLFTKERTACLRKTILTIVETSSCGTYPELAHVILYNIYAHPDRQEALMSFRALVACGRFPLHILLNKILERAQWLIPGILEELSSLSRTSLLFINEVLNNKKFYIDQDKFVYKALVLGMVKKRPERIVEILESFEDVPDDAVRMAALEFSRKVDLLFLEEKEEISKNTGCYIEKKAAEYEKTNAEKESRKGFFDALFSSTLDKKIKTLNQKNTEAVDFSHEIVENMDFSSQLFLPFMNFNCCDIKESDFSDASFVNADFKNCLLKNLNFDRARFEGISFDNTIFINVSARKSVFVNCSFYNTRHFHSDFNRAYLVDAVFTGAVVADVSFKGANLTGATFAGGEISNLYFVESVLYNTDFSGVLARFCRFPSHSFPIIESEQADFNARNFPVSFSDLPEEIFYESANGADDVSKFDLLLLTECMRFGKKQFLRQNKYSILTAFDLFKSRQADLFDIIPLLIHENIDFPGFISENENAPSGISGYFPTRETKSTAEKYLKKEGLKFRLKKNVYVEALYTMGSTGSIAQESDSDIDYWICVRNQTHTILKQNFQYKLDLLEKWALEQFKTEIHFFIVDIVKAKRDQFGDSSIESSGSAQGRILKEEFYRTMIHVAGKLPLWCTLSASMARNFYQPLYDFVCRNPAECRYIDLGDIHDIPAGEYFGASIWQMFKLLKSPFKSVLKMALLDTFIHETGEEALLCNKIKDQWMTSGIQFDLEKTDSYYVLLNSLVHYYQSCSDPDAVKLVQLCFFLKAGIAARSNLENTLFGFRKEFISLCMDNWKWDLKQVFDAGRFSDWEYASVNRLSDTIEKYMVKIYKKVNHAFDKEDMKQVLITPEDRTALGRKMFVQFSKHPEKIEKNLLVFSGEKFFQRLNLRYNKHSGKKKPWELINKQSKMFMGREELLYKGETIEKIAAWFVHNRYYTENTVIHLVPNATAVSVDDINALLKQMNAFFLKNEQNIRFEDLNAREVIKSLFISLNLCTSRKIKKIQDCAAVYQNSWGEMFCVFFSKQDGFASVKDFVNQLKKKLNIDRLPENSIVFLPTPLKLGNEIWERIRKDHTAVY